MKRLTAYALCILFIGSFACAPAASTNTASATEATQTSAAATPAPTAEPAPGPLGLTPIDLLGRGYNPLIDVPFPDGYTAYGALFCNAEPGKGIKDAYILYLTAAGDPNQILKTIANILGVTDEKQLTAYTESLEKDGFVQMDGTFAGSPANAGMKKTNAGADFDQCADVDGCRVEIGVELGSEQVEKYRALALANYNTAMLGDLAAQLSEDTIQRDKLAIYVNVQKPDKTVVYVTHAVADAAALMTGITGTLKTTWVDEANPSLGMEYATQQARYSFDTANNMVRVEFSPNDNSAIAGEFRKSAVSFTSLGFTSYPNDGLCIYKEDQNHLEIAIAKPDWGHNEDWNFEFLGESNGYSLGMWYTEATGLFHVSVNQGDKGAAAEYIVAEGIFAPDVYPDENTQKQMFCGAAGISEGDYRTAVFAIFEQAIEQRFGMGWQELYALPVW